MNGMLLRRITEHVKGQNWTAIALDFFIVVVGVFIGIQVSNWNERLAFEKREQVLLRELRGEVVQNMADARSKGEAFLIGAYWERCYSLEEAIEVYVYPCPPPGDIAIDPAKIAAILANPEIAPSLREWTTLSRVVGELLTEPHQALGDDILKHIDGAGKDKR